MRELRRPRGASGICENVDGRTGRRLEAQIRDLKSVGCVKIFSEKVSSVGGRAELDRALDYVRGGDTLVVTKVDRHARSTVGLWEIVKRLEAVDQGNRLKFRVTRGRKPESVAVL